MRKDAFEVLARRRVLNDDIKFSKALEANYDDPQDEVERATAAAISEYRQRKRTQWESDLFKQRTRLVTAERALSERETKKALNDQRVAGNKVKQYRRWLEDLDRRELKASDSRIFPFWFAPVIADVDGERVIMPMRYHLRQNGKPEWTDRKSDGLYNARRDNLEGYWKSVFGRRHAIFVATSFYENVSLHTFEKRDLRPGEKEQNVVLHFNPRSSEPMLLACLWNCWQAPGKPDLFSFAAITDGNQIAKNPAATKNFDKLCAAGLKHLTAEAIVLDHPDLFSKAAVEVARRRLGR